MSQRSHRIFLHFTILKVCLRLCSELLDMYGSMRYGRKTALLAVRRLSKSEILTPLARDLYESYHHFISGKPQQTSTLPRALTEEDNLERRDPKHMKHSILRKALEQCKEKPKKLLDERIARLQEIVGNTFTILAEEAVSVLCGLSNSRVTLNSSKTVYEGWQFRKLGEGIYKTTKDSLLIFSDVQYLSTPSEDLEDLLRQISDDKTIIPLFMKGALIHDLVVPFTGAGRLTEETDIKEINEAIRDATSIGSFYTLLGILVLKYGKERVVEEYLVPQVFNGSSGIIQHISQRISHRQ